MQIRVEVPLTLHLLPPTLIRHVIGGVAPEQVKSLFPNVANRMVDLGKYAATAWQAKIEKIPGATGRPLAINPYRPLNREVYESSIRLAPLSWDPELSIEVYSDEQQAELIEKGTAEIDMHDVLKTSEKARLTKPRRTASGEGHQHLYLRVPFRHATQSAEGGPVLPKSVIAAMQPKRKYLVAPGQGYPEPSPNYPGQMVMRNRYTKRPGRLTMEDVAALNMKAAARKGYLITPEQAGKLAGLMRVGGSKHGGYLTIRTLSEANPEGWRIPPYPAQHLLQKVREEVEQEVSTGFFDEAIRADMHVWLANAGA